MDRYYRIEKADLDMPLYAVWRGSCFTGGEFDGRFPVRVFGPMSLEACEEFVRQVADGGFEFTARDNVIGAFAP